jgi:AbrB family looped-hinge helix DNA binding protein
MGVTAVQYLPLAKVQVQERGAVTIPANIRREMAMGAGDTLTVLRVGDSLILTRKRLQLPEITAEFEAVMREEGVTLEDLLDDLDTQRAGYVREQYGLDA